jgi:hypothetical protein
MLGGKMQKIPFAAAFVSLSMFPGPVSAGPDHCITFQSGPRAEICQDGKCKIRRLLRLCQEWGGNGDDIYTLDYDDGLTVAGVVGESTTLNITCKELDPLACVDWWPPISQ